MDNSKLYTAYSNLLKNLAKKSISDHFLSNEDFIFLADDQQLFFNIIDITNETREVSGLIRSYLLINPEKNEDKDFIKQILLRLTHLKDIRFCFENFNMREFEKDVDVCEKLVLNTNGYFWGMMPLNNHDWSHFRKNEELMQRLMKSDMFSMNWFDLPAPKDRDVILKSLRNDADSFFSLDKEAQGDKEYIVAALSCQTERIFKRESLEGFYKSMSQEHQKDPEICNLLLAKEFSKFHEDVFDKDFIPQFLTAHFLRNIHKSVNNKRYLNNISEKMNPDICKDNEKFKVFIDWVVENSKFLHNDKVGYEHFHNALRNFARANTFVKERFKNSNVWRLCDLSKTHTLSPQAFEKYFSQNIIKIKQEVDIQVNFELMQKKLDNKNEVRKKMKL